MIDISDGLSSDLHHLCGSSKMGAMIDASALPIDTDVMAKFGPNAGLEMALNGGEDFQLLFTGKAETVIASGINGITKIGEVTTNEGVIEITANGSTRPLHPRGFQHFSAD
jgi:thiamine-monophosphate kinase